MIPPNPEPGEKTVPTPVSPAGNLVGITTTQLQSVVEDALKLLRSTLPETVSIEQQIDVHCPSVRADPGQIHRAVLNLCVNAWHAMPTQEGVIRVSLQLAWVDAELAAVEPRLVQGPNVRLRVSHDGQGNSGPATVGRGIAEVETIVRNNNGAMLLRTAAVGEKTFEIYFPACPLETARVAEAVAARAASGGERILYVDDDALVGAALTELLSLLGFNITHRLVPEEALAVFASRPDDFDLMITDRAMPGMTGGELAAAVLKIRPGLPILLVTGYADPAMEKELIQIGVREVLSKPLSAQKLGDAVRRTLNAPGTIR